MSPQLSAEQERGRTAFLQWYRNPHKSKPYFFLTGGAGRGKTFLTKAIIDSIRGNVLLATPTGKAALVLAKATQRPVQTIHSLIYRPQGTGGNKLAIEKADAELKTLDPLTDKAIKLAEQLKKLLSGVKPLFSLNLDSSLSEADLLVVDEASMVGPDTINDLLSFNVPLLVLGDPYQLPPVMAQSFFKANEADFCLTEIHRQAKDSPIIHLAELARQGKPLSVGQYGSSRVTREVSPEEAIAHDQIIVGKNETRHATNHKIRILQNREGDYPNIGEKVICRRNNNKLGLLNGDQFTVTSYEAITKHTGIIGLTNETLSTRVTCHSEFFVMAQVKGKWTVNEPSPWDIPKAECFQYGYVTTAHSAQGSGYPSVYILDQSRCFGRDIASKWLYTSITRAAERVTIKLL
jgi:exodeoxyribonuclease-5